MSRPKKPTVLWYGGDSSTTLSGQMAAHRRATQGVVALREIRASAAAAAAEAARKASQPAPPPPTDGSK